MIVFDLMKEDNLYSLDPYSMLLFITKKLPAIPGVSVFLGPEKHKLSEEIIVTSFRPACLERDDAIVLIKSYVPEHNSEMLEIVMEEVIRGFNDKELFEVGFEMKKFVVKQTTMDETKRGLFDRISRLNLSGSLTRETKHEILTLWFSNAITGPFCITRALDLIGGQHVLNCAVISCAITRAVQARVGCDKFWNFAISYLLVTDPNFYIISGDINQEMNFPRQVSYNHIGLRVAGIKYNVVPEKITHQFTPERLPNGAEFHAVMVINSKTKQRRLKLEYGKEVFGNLHSLIIHVANSTRFDKWCKNAVEWEIWFGRDEQTKLQDYRMLKLQNKELARQVIQLQRQLAEQSNGKSPNASNDSMENITDSDIEIVLNQCISKTGNEINNDDNANDVVMNESETVNSNDIDLKEDETVEDLVNEESNSNDIDLKEVETVDNLVNAKSNLNGIDFEEIENVEDVQKEKNISNTIVEKLGEKKNDSNGIDLTDDETVESEENEKRNVNVNKNVEKLCDEKNDSNGIDLNDNENVESEENRKENVNVSKNVEKLCDEKNNLKGIDLNDDENIESKENGKGNKNVHENVEKLSDEDNNSNTIDLNENENIESLENGKRNMKINKNVEKLGDEKNNVNNIDSNDDENTESLENEKRNINVNEKNNSNNIDLNENENIESLANEKNDLNDENENVDSSANKENRSNDNNLNEKANDENDRK